jgi:hypothetical protein
MIGVGIQENSLLPSHKQQILQKFKFLCLKKIMKKRKEKNIERTKEQK